MSPAQTPSPTAADRCEQPDQIVAAGGARPDELETPVRRGGPTQDRGPQLSGAMTGRRRAIQESGASAAAGRHTRIGVAEQPRPVPGLTSIPVPLLNAWL